VSDGFSFLRDQNWPNYLSAIAIPQTEDILETFEIRSRVALHKKNRVLLIAAVYHFRAQKQLASLSLPFHIFERAT
jgi:hypothetical protein